MSKQESLSRLATRYKNFDLQTVVQNRMAHPSKQNAHLVQVQAKVVAFEFSGDSPQARTLGSASGLAEGSTVAEAEDAAIVRAIENLGV